MKGLEINEFRLSELENEFTIGAEYYSPSFVTPFNALMESGMNTESLWDICRLITDGDHGSADYADEGIPFLLSENIRDGWVNYSNCRYITPTHALTLKRSRLAEGNVLITKTGVYFGKSAVVPNEMDGANTIAHVGVMKLKDGIDPYYLSTFMNSKFGQAQLRRRGIKATRPEIKLLEFADIQVGIPTSSFQDKIRQFLVAAIDILEGKARRESAEQTLLQALGLENWSPPEPLSYTRKASEVWEAGRLDAEYFPPIYDALFDKIRAGEFVRLGDCLTEPLRRGISPDYDEDGEVLVINSQHVAKDQVILEGNRRAKHPALGVKGGVAASRTGLVRKGDVLMNSTGHMTIGRCHCLLEDVTAVVDNHVAIIRPKAELDPVYLACFLNGLPGKLQTERGFTGSSGQIELRPDVIADYLVWVAPWETQMAIRNAVESSHAARATAAELLERAKRAVEIAIEQSEAAALAYLEA